MLKTAGVAVGAAMLAALAAGQGPGEIRATSAPYLFAPVIVAQTTTVPLTVVVRDRNGRVIRGLKEGQFRLTDDGRPQRLTSFEVETAPRRGGAPAARVGAASATAAAPRPAPTAVSIQPRYVALLFDDVNSNLNDLMQARNAAVRFMHEELGPGDRMAVFTTSGSQSLGFTRDRAALAQTIAEIEPHPRADASGRVQCPRITAYEAYLIVKAHDPTATQAVEQEASACQEAGASLMGGNGGFGAASDVSVADNSDPVHFESEGIWEMTRGVAQDTLAAVRDVVDYMAKQPGQRIVVLASSGFLSETLGDQKDRIVRDALRAGVVVDALDAKGLYTEGPGPPLAALGEEPILPLATYIFNETAKFPMEEAKADAMASLAAATGGLFFQNNNDLTLGFERVGLAPAVSYELAFTPAPLVRDGKLHKLEVSLDPPIQGATIEARRGYYAPVPGLSGQEVEQDLYQAMASTSTANALPASVAAEEKAGELQVQVQLGVTEPKQRIAMVAGLFDAKGNFVMGRRSEVDLALKNATFQRLSKSGLAPSFTLKTQPGAYRLRVVVLDEANGAASEFNREVRLK